jgi:hypothetical protein
MGDASFDGPNDVLTALAALMAQMRKVAIFCQSNPEVTEAELGCDVIRVRHDFDANELVNNLISYVEVMTRSNRSLTWLLSIDSTKRYWLLSRSVVENRAEGQDTLIEFPDQKFEAFGAFLLEIERLTAELAATVTTFRFGAG